MYVVGGRFPSRGVVDPPRHVIDPRCWCPPTHVGERDSDITQNGERLFFFPSCRRTQRAPRAESGTDKAKQSHDEDTAHNSDTAAVDGAGNRPAEEKAANSAETSYGGEEGRKAMAALHWCHMSSLRWCMPGVAGSGDITHEKGSVLITQGDYARLNSGELLNDSVIDCYLK